jgi:hypothetical protein
MADRITQVKSPKTHEAYMAQGFEPYLDPRYKQRKPTSLDLRYFPTPTQH